MKITDIAMISIASLPFLTGCAVISTGETSAVQSLNAFVDRVVQTEGSSPGYAVVVADADGALLVRTGGVLNAENHAPVRQNSPFYIASMTKAYVGLLAARLHADGILDLDSTLGDYWPNVHIGENVDVSQVTLRDLLTHQEPFNVDMITFLESYVTDIPASLYPQYLSRFGEPREPGFEYDNLGYNIYAAILFQVTGHDWHYWLREKVLEPLDLEQTASRTSTFEIDDMAWRHQWKGGANWYSLPPKTDPQMQSAGGMMTSARDLAMWLSANLRNRDQAVFRAAQTSYVNTGDDDDGDMKCHGYTLGWNECSFHGMRVLQHGGGYVGARSFMAIAPENGVAIGVMANSDNMTGYMSAKIAEFHLAQVAGVPWTHERIEDTLASYAGKMTKLLAGRLQQVEDDRANERWAGWRWNPAIDQLSEYEGTYGNNELGDVIIRITDAGLSWQLDGWKMNLLPATRDRFGGSMAPYEELQQIDFERNHAGDVIGLHWNDFSFPLTSKARTN